MCPKSLSLAWPNTFLDLPLEVPLCSAFTLPLQGTVLAPDIALGCFGSEKEPRPDAEHENIQCWIICLSGNSVSPR